MKTVYCPSRDDLSDFLSRGSTPEEDLRIESHLETCEQCQQEADTLTFGGRFASAIRSQKGKVIDVKRINDLILRIHERVAPGTLDVGETVALPRVGQAFGDYEIVSLIGRGGMGSVFLATESHLNREVALKLIHADRLTEKARLRFNQEASAAARLESDHIVTVYTAGEINGTPYIAMQRLRGETLADRIKRDGRLTNEQAGEICLGICRGLQQVHAANMIHRDIKPANIWLETESDRVKILDFGLAEVPLGADGRTVTGSIVGTPKYMSPEQTRGQTLDERSDLFSVGCVLYEMTTGKRPFDGDSVADVITSIVRDDPVTPLRQPGASQRLSSLTMSLLAKDPNSRPQTAVEVIQKIEEPNPPTAVRGVRWRTIITPVVAALVLIGISFGQYLFRVQAESGVIELRINDGPTRIEVDVSRQNIITVTDPNDGTEMTIRIDPDRDSLVVQKSGFELFATSFSTALSDGRDIHAELQKARPVVNATKPKDERRSDYKWPANGPRPGVIPFDAVVVQKDVAAELKLEVETENSIGMKLRLIPAGEFQMGFDSENPANEVGQFGIDHSRARGSDVLHRVVISRPFYASATEVTVKQLHQILPKHPGGNGTVQTYPAVFVSWVEAVEACNELSRREGLQLCYTDPDGSYAVDVSANGYRLPTEAEWEFMYRAGTDSVFPEPKDLLAKYSWFEANANGKIQSVANLKANRFGLYDMGGNVWEWCHDRYMATYYREFFNLTVVDPTGPLKSHQKQRIVRGADWSYNVDFLRSSLRSRYFGNQSGYDIGFRVVRTITAP